jgi:hypothetical protein
MSEKIKPAIDPISTADARASKERIIPDLPIKEEKRTPRAGSHDY